MLNEKSYKQKQVPHTLLWMWEVKQNKKQPTKQKEPRYLMLIIETQSQTELYDFRLRNRGICMQFTKNVKYTTMKC